MNRIRVSSKEILNIISDNSVFESEAPELLNHIYQHGFIFNEYCLIWEDTYIYKVRIKGIGDDQVIYIKKIYETSTGKHEHKNIEFTLEDYLENLSEFYEKYNDTKEYTKEIVEDSWSADYTPVISFMQYVLYRAKNQEVIYKDKADRHYNYTGKAAATNKEYKLIDVIRHYAEHINHGKHNITCEHWIVKGHFRHYRSGKVVYIKPFSKGKNKNATPADREYRL